jgi:Co/Zn/Cd efflux system component
VEEHSAARGPGGELDDALALDLGSAAGGPDVESLRTVLVALAANALIALAKSVAAVITTSASLTAEAAHSWADAGN